MTPESPDQLRLEIGHVLFIDLVGYSKLLIEEQNERLRLLTEIVLATAQVREAPNEELVRLPTGDGMALVFRNSPEEPAQCALEIARALKERPEIAVRMGIHSRPVSQVTDLTGRTNIAGAGINLAQRVMDFPAELCLSLCTRCYPHLSGRQRGRAAVVGAELRGWRSVRHRRLRQDQDRPTVRPSPRRSAVREADRAYLFGESGKMIPGTSSST